MTHGVQQLLGGEPAGDYGIAYAVLAVASVLEGAPFAQASRRARRAGREGGTSTLRSVSTTLTPTVESDVEDHERIEEAVLTLSTPDEQTLTFGRPPLA